MRIVHTIGLVIGCALGFATYRGLTPPLNAAFRSFGHSYDMVMGVALGLILNGGVTLAWRRWRGDGAALSQPGHWLLAFGWAAALAAGGAIGAYYGWYRLSHATIDPPHWVQVDQAWTPSVPGLRHQMVGWGLGSAAALAFCGVSFHRLRWHWWALFLVAALGSLAFFAGYTAALFDFWGRAVAISWCKESAHLYGKLVAIGLLLLVFAVTRDVWQGQRGDGLHWTGIAAWTIILTMQLALYFRYMFWPMPLSQSVQALFTL